MFRLFSNLFDPHGYQAEEMFTFKEREKTNHYPNYISKTTQFSTSFLFKHIIEDCTGEPKPTSADSWRSKSDLLAVKELRKYRRDGFTKIRLRDLSYRAKEYLGILPRTNKNDKEEYVAYSDAPSPSSTAAKATTFWDAWAAANPTNFWDTPSPSSTAAKELWDAPAANATIFFGTIYWEVETIIKCFDVLPQDVIDLILANLPTKDIVRYRSVCKRWDSMLTSCLSFRSSFHASSTRRPWFLLLDTLTSPKRKNLSSSTIQPEAVYNMEVSALGDWCPISIKIPIAATTVSTTRMHKVDFVSSGGLICSMSESNGFIVCNPCTGASHQLPPLPDSDGGHNIKGMALHVSPCSKLLGRLRYEVSIVIVKKDRILRIKTYSSSLNSQERGAWTEKLQLDLADPFLHVWNPKRTTGAATIGREGNILLHFVTHDGSKSVCCDTHSGTIFMNPRFLPSLQCCKVSELVVCDGKLYVVLILSGDIQRPLASAQLQVHKYSRDENSENAMNKWSHVSTLPEELSTKSCIGKKDHDHAISCAGYGNHIMVYVTCASSNYSFMFNIKEKAWVLLPPQPSSNTRTGHKMEIFSLMPDID